VRSWIGCLVVTFAASGVVTAQQVPADLARERDEYARWLATAPVSPYAAHALVPVGAGISLGEGERDVLLPGQPAATISEKNGTVTLERGDTRTPLPRGRVTSLGGPWRVLLTGAPGRTVATVFGSPSGAKAPTYYPYAPDAVMRVTLQPPAAPRTVPLLGPDGAELLAAEAGSAGATWRGRPIRLTVLRLPGATPDESELQVFFRDRTSAHGSYDGGRFVELVPADDGGWILDFNRARNPFCAYSTVFPCPAPWPGNTLDVEVAAGERYERKPPSDPGT